MVFVFVNYSLQCLVFVLSMVHCGVWYLFCQLFTVVFGVCFVNYSLWCLVFVLSIIHCGVWCLFCQ